MNLRLWLRILIIDAIDLHGIPGNLTTYFHLDYSINVEFVNWPLISMHDVRLCLKLFAESKKCREHGTLNLIVRCAFRERNREREKEKETDRQTDRQRGRETERERGKTERG